MNSFSLFDVAGSAAAASPPNHQPQIYQLFSQRPPAVSSLGGLLRQSDPMSAPSCGATMPPGGHAFAAQRLMQDQYGGAGGGAMNNRFYEPVGPGGARQMMEHPRFLPIQQHPEEVDLLQSLMPPTTGRAPRLPLWTTQQGALQSYSQSEGIQAPMNNLPMLWNEKPIEEFPALQSSFATTDNTRITTQLDTPANQRWGCNILGGLSVSTQQHAATVFPPPPQVNVRYPLAQQVAAAHQLKKHQANYPNQSAQNISALLLTQQSAQFQAASTQYQNAFPTPSSSQNVSSTVGFPHSALQRQELNLQRQEQSIVEQRSGPVGYPWPIESHHPPTFSQQSGGPHHQIAVAPSGGSYNAGGGVRGYGNFLSSGGVPPSRANTQGFMDDILAARSHETKVQPMSHMNIDRAAFEQMANMKGMSSGMKVSEAKMYS